MGQKINPHSMRLGYIRSWDSRWYSKRDYASLLHEDLSIRNYLAKNLERADIARVEINRFPERVNVVVHTARPGVVIGKKGADIEKLKDQLTRMTGKKVHISIVEVKQPDLSAKLVGEAIARQLRGRSSFKKVMKQSIGSVMRSGAKGVKIMLSGRLGGAEMSRTESYKDGRVPLHTIRADVDYGFAVAKTQQGIIGVKVWIYRGEVIGRAAARAAAAGHRTDEAPRRERSGGRRDRRRDQGQN